MNSVTSFVNGSNPKINLAALAIAVSATAYLKLRKPLQEMEGEEVEEMPKPRMMSILKKYGPFVIIILLVIPLLVGQMKNSPSSSFQARVSTAASELRDSLNESVSPVSESDFQERVSEAARKLREEIASKRDATSSSALSGGPTASSLAAQASAEISKFIADNS